jgi:hypothetical protein
MVNMNGLATLGQQSRVRLGDHDSRDRTAVTCYTHHHNRACAGRDERSRPGILLAAPCRRSLQGDWVDAAAPVRRGSDLCVVVIEADR